MKPIFNKTGLENLLELIKSDNPSAIINAEQLMEVTIDVNRDNGNATAVLVAEVDQGYSGSVAVEWVRQQFVNYITDGNYIQLLEGETEVEVKERIAQTFNLVLSDLTYQGFSLPELTQNQAVVFTMTGNEGFVYPETTSVSVLISTVAITEETRGNVDMIRVTNNGLVRGIVVKDPGGDISGPWLFINDEAYNDSWYDEYGKLYPDTTDPLLATTTYTPFVGGGDQSNLYVGVADVTFTPKGEPEVIYMEFELDVTGYTPDYNNSGIRGRFVMNWPSSQPADVDSFIVEMENGVWHPSYGPTSLVYTVSGDQTFPYLANRPTRAKERFGVLVDQVANTYTVIHVNDAVTDENLLDNRAIVTHTFQLTGAMSVGYGLEFYGDPALSSNPAYPDIKGLLIHNGPTNSFLKTLVDPTLLAKIESAVPLSTVTQNCVPTPPYTGQES